MKITRRSGISGIVRTKNIPITQEQYDAWNAGLLIQDAMPNISADEREFIMTGITSEEWDDMFGEDNYV